MSRSNKAKPRRNKLADEIEQLIFSVEVQGEAQAATEWLAQKYSEHFGLVP